MSQKGFSKITLVIIIIILAGIAGYFMLIKKSEPIAQQPTPTPALTYITISELEFLCDLPSKCNERLSCEGENIFVKGYIDYTNVFEKKSYPQLPYEKFRLMDKEISGTHFLEIFVTVNNTSAVLKKIYDNETEPSKMVFINGQIEGFDMPTMGECWKSIKINITSENEINFTE